MNETETLDRSASSPLFCPTPATLFMAGLVPVCAMLMLPGLCLCIFQWNVHCFSTGAVVFLAAACLCFVPGRLFAVLKAMPVYVRAALGVLFLIGLYHVLRHGDSYQIKDMGRCFLYTVIPLFGMVFRRELLKLLPWLFTIFWIMNLASTIGQKVILHSSVAGGIPSNLNWNASFTAVTAAAALFLIFTKLRKTWMKILPAVLIVSVSLYMEWLCSSRALILGSFCAILVFLWTRLETPRAKKLFRLGIILMLGLGALGIFAVLNSRKGKEYLRDDDRVFLAATVPDMIAHAPVLGYGTPSFEQEYLPWRNAGFFQLSHTTDRVDHPHNDILFTAAGFGIAGLICWLILCLVPVIRLIQGKTENIDPFTRLLFFLFLILLIHAQLDLVFFHLPLSVFSTLILGILWGGLHPAEAENGSADSVLHLPLRLLLDTAGAALIFGCVFSAAGHLISYHLLWLGEAELHHHGYVTPAALEYFTMATKVPQAPPHALTKASARSYADGNFRSQVILSAFEAMKKTPIPDYGHMNLLEARALEEEGRLAESELCYLRENELFPLEVLPLMHLSRVYLRTGDREKFEEAQRAIRELMDRKGIDEHDIQLIIEHPEYDMRPWEIPGKKLKNGKAVPADQPDGD